MITLIIESGAVSNGNIVMGDGDDTLTIGSGAIINGTLNGGKATTSAPPVPITTFATEIILLTLVQKILQVKKKQEFSMIYLVLKV